MIPATRATPRLPSPYRPDPKPHLTRTAVLLALIGAVLVAITWAALELTGPTYRIPREVYQPSYPVTAPAWLEPTAPPAPSGHPGRPQHPAAVYTPGPLR